MEMGTNGTQRLMGFPGTWAPSSSCDPVERPCCVWQQAQGCPCLTPCPNALVKRSPQYPRCPEGRLGSSSVPSARERMMPVAQEMSCQGHAEGHCTPAVCLNCHITRAQPSWTPPNSHSSPPNLQAGDKTLWRNPGSGAHTSVVASPFSRHGVRIPGIQCPTPEPYSLLTPCPGQALGLRVLPGTEPC